jgi:hypothetical protein
MTWEAYAAYLAAIPATATVTETVPPLLQEMADHFGGSPSGDIAGLVTDGSSKAVA